MSTAEEKIDVFDFLLGALSEAARRRALGETEPARVAWYQCLKEVCDSTQGLLREPWWLEEGKRTLG